jgi:neopullulanase
MIKMTRSIPISTGRGKILVPLILLCLSSCLIFSQTNLEVYPTHWWVGMHLSKIQLMVYGKNIADQANIKLSYPDVQLSSIDKMDNPNYLMMNLTISANAKPGRLKFEIHQPAKTTVLYFELKARRKENDQTYARGVTSADLIYLIMPDRFSNGDSSNDKFSDMNDTLCDRSNPFLRHGGDLQGIINHLDYFNDLGVTALWLTPLIENDQPLNSEGGSMRSSYHGYGFTNQYKIDRRFGGNEAYIKLVHAAHTHGIKIIQDAVYNHVGNKHFLFLDPPSKEWFNQWPSYTQTSYRDQPLIDEHAAKTDKEITVNGWFTPFLPDLNQRNPFVATYLIQYAIWAVEEFGIDGWRVDTYFYSDKDFLNRINKALYDEFPHISLFGETTTRSVVEQAFFMQNNLNVAWKSNLQGVTDYEWFSGALSSLSGNSGEELYSKLVQDILYFDPMRNEIFLDNHDQDRFYSVIGEDFSKYKMGIALLLTQRGIPQLYYGTEILMKNRKIPSDAEVRKDFPGGWEGDSLNKFNADQRTALENEAYNYVKTIARFRKNSSAIRSGKLMQYVPSDGTYVYFRYDDNQTIMCVMNASDKEKQIDFSKYPDRIKKFLIATNIVDHTVYKIPGTFSIAGKQFLILELKK